MNRPALKIGDVVRLSKYGKSRRGLFLNSIMVVDKCGGDTSDGRTRIECSTFAGGSFTGKASFKRRELWYTGYNAYAKSGNNVITQKINRDDLRDVPVRITSGPMATNDGRTHCIKCSKPTKFVPGFGAGGYNLCQNKSCSMYDR